MAAARGRRPTLKELTLAVSLFVSILSGIGLLISLVASGQRAFSRTIVGAVKESPDARRWVVQTVRDSLPCCEGER